MMFDTPHQNQSWFVSAPLDGILCSDALVKAHRLRISWLRLAEPWGLLAIGTDVGMDAVWLTYVLSVCPRLFMPIFSTANDGTALPTTPDFVIAACRDRSTSKHHYKLWSYCASVTCACGRYHQMLLAEVAGLEDQLSISCVILALTRILRVGRSLTIHKA
jgi:hypothetical protein